MGDIPLDNITEAPASGYEDTAEPVVGHSYVMRFLGKYGKIRISQIRKPPSVSVAEYDFEWVYQPDGTTSFEESGASPTPTPTSTPTPTPPAPTSTPTPTPPPGDCSWLGLWNTTFDSMSTQIHFAYQLGDQVGGTYDWEEGRIKGTISGNTLTGTWSEAPSHSPPDDAGDFTFIMSGDCQSFTGQWRYGSTGSWSNWDGTRAGSDTTTTPTPTPVVTSAPTSTPIPTQTPTTTIEPRETLLIADDTTVSPRGTVQVPVRLENAHNLASLGFNLQYDSAVAEVTNVVKGSLLKSFTFIPNYQEAGIIRFSFASQAGKSGSGWAAVVEFKAVGPEGSQSDLILSDILATDATGAPLSARSDNGVLTIGKRQTGDADGIGGLNEADALHALRMYVKLEPEDLAVDMNGDGSITPDDARIIMQQVASGSLSKKPNSAPIADARADQNVSTGSLVTLDGSGSTDADGDTLAYSWSLTSKPAGSAASLSDPAAMNPTFTADMSGSYEASLVVNDGTVASEADAVTITAVLEESITQTVTSGGGTLSLSNGIELVIPADSVPDNESASITLSTVVDDTIFDSLYHTVLEIEGEGTIGTSQLKIPVEADTEQGEIGAAYFDPDTGVLTPLEGTLTDSDYVVELNHYSTIVVEKSPKYTPKSTKKVLQAPYYEQFGGNCWAAAWLMLLKSNKSSLAYDTIYELLYYLGIEKDAGIKPGRLDDLADATERWLGLEAEDKYWYLNKSFENYVVKSIDEGKPVLAHLGMHQGLFVGYEKDQAGTVKLIYHDPQNQGAQRPYRAATAKQLEDDFIPGWEQWLTFDFFGTVTVNSPMPSGPCLQTIHMPDIDPLGASFKSALTSGVVFTTKNEKGRDEIVRSVRWDHTQPLGYRLYQGTEPKDNEIPPSTDAIHLVDVPIWNTSLNDTASLRVKAQVISEEVYLEKQKTLSVKPDSRYSYNESFDMSEVKKQITKAEHDTSFRLYVNLFDGSDKLLGFFYIDFVYEPLLVFPNQVSLQPAGTSAFVARMGGEKVSTIDWSIQEGATGGSISAEGVYTAPDAPGTYHVIATSQEDSSLNATATVVVSEAPQLSVQPTETIVNESVTAECTTPDAPEGTEWRFNWGDGAVETVSSSASSHSYSQFGEYNVTCTVVSPSGQEATSNTVKVTVKTGPEVNISVSPQSGEAPLAVTAMCSATDPDGTVVGYRVYFGENEANTTSGTASYTFDSDGTYYVYCVAVDNDGLEGLSEAVTVEVGEEAPDTSDWTIKALCPAPTGDDVLHVEEDNYECYIKDLTILVGPEVWYNSDTGLPREMNCYVDKPVDEYIVHPFSGVKMGELLAEYGWWDNGNMWWEHHYEPYVTEDGCPDWRADGLWITWHENGIKASEVHYIADKLSGTVKTWYEDGTPEELTTYANDVKEGLYQKWAENGRILVDGYYQNEKRDGLWTHWNSINGVKTLEIQWENDHLSGMYISYYNDTGIKEKEGTYQYIPAEDRSYRVSIWKYWDEDGNPTKEEEYKYFADLGDTAKDGTCTYWYSNGQKSNQSNYVKGKEDGTWISWYSNGNKASQGSYAEGKEDGAWTSWYSNGNKRAEGNYAEGKQDGAWTSWYSNGNKASQGSYANGTTVGTWTYWNEDGTLDRTYTY